MTTRKMAWNYVIFWSLPLTLILLAENELFPVGVWAENVNLNYLLDTIAILATALCVPLSLKLFSKVLHQKLGTLTITKALNRYLQWGRVRLLILAVPFWFNLLAFYLTLSNTGLYCALIIATASLFCIPSEKQLRSELHIYKDKD